MTVLTVSEVAELAGVSTAAVRARLADGTLKGRQEMRGKRPVWAVEADSARKYASERKRDSRGAQGRAAAKSAGGAVAQPDVSLRDLDDVVAQLPRVEQPRRDPGSAELDALRKENAQLRALVQGLQRAHSVLLAATTEAYEME